MISFSSTFLFGLQTDFYQIELSRVWVGVEFQSLMIHTIFLMSLKFSNIAKIVMFHNVEVGDEHNKFLLNIDF